jgi:hypothetical protein
MATSWHLAKINNALAYIAQRESEMKTSIIGENIALAVWRQHRAAISLWRK